jgi:hypothetical protein
VKKAFSTINTKEPRILNREERQETLSLVVLTHQNRLPSFATLVYGRAYASAGYVLAVKISSRFRKIRSATDYQWFPTGQPQKKAVAEAFLIVKLSCSS